MNEKTRVRLLKEIAGLITKQISNAEERLVELSGLVNRLKTTTPKSEMRRMQKDKVMGPYIRVSDISGFSLTDLRDNYMFIVIDDGSEHFGRIGIINYRGPGYWFSGIRKHVTLDENQVIYARNIEVILEEYDKRFDLCGQMKII